MGFLMCAPSKLLTQVIWQRKCQLDSHTLPRNAHSLLLSTHFLSANGQDSCSAASFPDSATHFWDHTNVLLFSILVDSWILLLFLKIQPVSCDAPLSDPSIFAI